MMDYDEFQAEVQRRKRERWARILAAEPPGRAPGRRPRDPDQERLLLEMDRARLRRERPSPDPVIEAVPRTGDQGKSHPTGQRNPGRTSSPVRSPSAPTT